MFLFSLSLFSFPSLSEGSNWKLVETLIAKDTKASDTYYYIDVNSIRKTGNKVRYWDGIISIPHGDPQPTDDQIAKGCYKSYYELDYSRRRYRDVTSEKEEGSGYVQVYPGIVWDNIKPDSIEEKIEKIVCKRKNKQETIRS